MEPDLYYFFLLLIFERVGGVERTQLRPLISVRFYSLVFIIHLSLEEGGI